jgi:hypothetical protein
MSHSELVLIVVGVIALVTLAAVSYPWRER